MSDQDSKHDPKGLMEDAFRMNDLDEAECRTIFLDWVLGLPVDADPKPAIQTVLEHYSDKADHPMKIVLREGLAEPPRKVRRGGRAARLKA